MIRFEVTCEPECPDLGGGGYMAYRSTMATAFEEQVRRLGLDEGTCVASKQLRRWCELNKDRYYIPEWLLKRWGISVEADTVVSRAPEARSHARAWPRAS